MSIILVANSQLICGELMHQKEHQPQRVIGGWGLFLGKPYGGAISDQRRMIGLFGKRESSRVLQTAAFWDEAKAADVVDLEEIKDCEHLDQVLLEAKELDQPVLIDWMATWCRKCIFLKPKLEKLASEYGTKLRFYCVDVNKVPQSLVKRANISYVHGYVKSEQKMPTIQLWKDGEFKEEVIGGHKAWLVVDEVRQMIQKFL